ncbi:MAG TPA: hypothetical protein VKX17_11830 [Planctomycetota bacterium]|nr:hypothetical protein [Planctomycetota bacterium]
MTDEMQKPAISNAAQKLREGAIEMKSAIVDKGSDVIQKVCEQTEATIKAYPYKSVLIAFGVGVALGALVLRR